MFMFHLNESQKQTLFCFIRNWSLKFMIKISIIIIFLFSIHLKAQTNRENLHSTIVDLYSVNIDTLGYESRQAYSKRLDDFWEMIKSNKSAYVPLLRNELRNKSNPLFFQYDSGKLLFNITNERSDKESFVNFISNSDLRKLPKFNLLNSLVNLLKDDFDVSDVAMHILDYPDYSVFLSAHFLTLGQNYTFIYLAIPSDEIKMTNKLIERLNYEKNDTTIKTILLSLYYLTNEKADSALISYGNNVGNNFENMNYAKSLLTKDEKGELPSGVFSFFNNIDSLKKRRKNILRRISDEALYDFEEISSEIRLYYKANKN